MGLGDLVKKKEPVYTMGIDSSTNSLAWSYFKGKELLKCGQVYFPGKRLEDRLIVARKILQHFNFSVVDEVYIEQAVYVNNKKTVIAMAQMLGVIISCIEPKTVRYLGPTEWGKVIGNSGLNKVEKALIVKNNPDKSQSWYRDRYREERKEITKRWVESMFGPRLPPKYDDNVADAIAIGFSGVTLHSD